MNRITLKQLLEQRTLINETCYQYVITEDWMQGRTTYGGLSACLCLDAAINVIPDLPPLRSAQVTFVGPVSGAVNVTISILRRGRSVASIHARLEGEKGIGTEAVFSFGAARESALDATYSPTPPVPTVAQSKPFFTGPGGPIFTHHFECLLAQGAGPVSGTDEDEVLLWVRFNPQDLAQINTIDPYVSLLALADMPPPAVLPKFKTPAPISSMTWMVNFLSAPTTNQEGWWLLRSAAENAQEGYSSQDMQVWNAAGDLIVSGRQSVAVFY